MLNSQDPHAHRYSIVLGNPVSASAIITQEELRELARLQTICKKYKTSRQIVRKKLEQGAIIEPGPLYVEIFEYEFTSFSKATLCDHFGQDFFQWLKAEITPRIKFVMKLCGKMPPGPLDE